jgi:uncharacterized membrane protein
MGAAAPGAAPGAVPPPVTGAGSTPMADNLVWMLCYLGGLITGIIFLVLEPYNKKPMVRFHAFQSIFANLACIVLWIALGIVFGIMGTFSFFFIFQLLRLVFLIGWILLMVAAYQGKKIVLPVIGPIAEQQAAK